MLPVGSPDEGILQRVGADTQGKSQGKYLASPDLWEEGMGDIFSSIRRGENTEARDLVTSGGDLKVDGLSPVSNRFSYVVHSDTGGS